MNEQAFSLAHGWSIWEPSNYVLLCIVGSLIVRIVSCFMTAMELHFRHSEPLLSGFWTVFRGYGVRQPDDNDYLFPFFLGLLEFAAFPVLMATEHWTFIGAWLGFKGVAQWKRWENERSVFNRF